MSVPSVTKIKKDGIEFTSSVDRVNYTIAELTRAALKDVGRFLAKRTREVMRHKTGRARRYLQYWVRKGEWDLLIGYKPGGFYAAFYETGSQKTAKEQALHSTVSANIAEIVRIESQYLSALEDEAAALAKIDENDEEG